MAKCVSVKEETEATQEILTIHSVFSQVLFTLSHLTIFTEIYVIHQNKAVHNWEMEEK